MKTANWTGIFAMLLIPLGFFMSQPAFAQVEYSGHLSWKSGYSLENLGFMACDESVTQGGATATLDNGLYGDFWFSDGDNEACDEQDYSIGFNTEAGGTNLHVQAAYFVIPGALENVTRARIEISDSVSREGLSFGWFVGIDDLNGLLETRIDRVGINTSYSWRDWSSSGTIGVSHRSDLGTVSTYTNLQFGRPVGDWTATISALYFVSPLEANGVIGIGASRSF